MVEFREALIETEATRSSIRAWFRGADVVGYSTSDPLSGGNAVDGLGTSPCAKLVSKPSLRDVSTSESRDPPTDEAQFVRVPAAP